MKRLRGRIIAETEGSEKDVSGILSKVPGISGFSFAAEAERDMDSIKKALDALAEKQEIRTFAVSSSRADKGFHKTSNEMNVELGDHLRKKYGWKVDLSNPETTFFVEVTGRQAFVYTARHRGMGGLPAGTGGRLISLLSGGIDSPVAAYEMLKRGCEIVFVHFHNWTGQKEVVRDKVERIAGVLSASQPRTRLYMVPFGDIQKQLLLKVPSDYRMIIYRRMMFAIAGMIARKEKALGFVTGDSVGQVASQTLENILCIYDRACYPVFTPVAGANKEEIIAKAREIGTYELSILPYSDCCSFLVAKHPVTKARLRDVERIEGGIDVVGLAKKALDDAEIREF